MIIEPTVVQLLNKAENRYSLVIATAKRARQISNGSKPLTNKDDVSPITLAADEIEDDKVKIYNQNEWEQRIEAMKGNGENANDVEYTNQNDANEDNNE